MENLPEGTTLNDLRGGIIKYEDMHGSMRQMPVAHLFERIAELEKALDECAVIAQIAIEALGSN